MLPGNEEIIEVKNIFRIGVTESRQPIADLAEHKQTSDGSKDDPNPGVQLQQKMCKVYFWATSKIHRYPVAEGAS